MSADDQRGRPVGARTRRRRELRRLNRRSFGLTTLALVPGAGLTRTRYRAFGWVLLALTAIGLLGLAYLVLGNRLLSTALEVAVQPDLLLALAGIAIVVALVWMFSIILTQRGTEPSQADRISRFGLRFWTGILCLAIAAPTVQMVRYTAIQRDVVGTVFASGDSGEVPAVGSTVARPNKTAEDSWKDVPRVNMLLLGSDAGDDRDGVRTDSMVVASIDTKTGNTVLISIPRNLQRVPFPEQNPLHAQYPNGYYCPNAKPGDECLINGVWTLADENKSLFKNDKNPGLTTIRGVIGQVTGLNMDYSTVIDLKGFEELVNAMGGVTINVTERLPMNGYHPNDDPTRIAGVEGWIEPGVQKLSGHQALWYARSRLTTDDFSRMRRQRCLIGTILDQVNPSTMLAKYPELAQVAKENITTDVGLKDLPAWVQLVERIQKGSISSLTFTEDNVNTVRPDFDKIHQLVADAINPPKPTSTGTKTGVPTGTSTSTSTKTPQSSTTSRTPDGDTAVDVKAAC